MESRDVGEQPEVAASAERRPHFRAGSAVKLTTIATVEQPPPETSAPPKPTAKTVEEPIHGGLDDPYPAGSAILVRHGDSGWWKGVVQRSFCSRPRVSSTPPERRIVVEYDDPRYHGELFEHGLRGTPVKLQTPAKRRGEPETNARVTRRQQRIAELGLGGSRSVEPAAGTSEVDH